MIIVDIQDNSQMVINFLKKAGRSLSNLSIPLKQSGMLMMKSIDTNFKAQGRPAKWKALASSTIKARKKGSSTILQDTGTLKNSITLDVRGTKEVAIGTSLIYAPTHNFGRVSSKGGGGKTSTTVIPQRKFLLFQNEDVKRIDKIFVDYIGRVLTNKLTNIG